MPAEDFYGIDLGSAHTLSTTIDFAVPLTPVVEARYTQGISESSFLPEEGIKFHRGDISKVIAVYEGASIGNDAPVGIAISAAVELAGNQKITATSVTKLVSPAVEALPETVFQIWG
jgi:hypothetical protein